MSIVLVKLKSIGAASRSDDVDFLFDLLWSGSGSGGFRGSGGIFVDASFAALSRIS